MDIKYETAWLLLHKLRRAMVNGARELSFANIGRRPKPLIKAKHKS
jgi:hypothetical protein